GERRIGVAVSDPGESFALPLGVIERTAVDEDVGRIVAMAREHDARAIVVGDPLRLGGERGPACERVDRFVLRLQRRWDGPIERVDERLTTAQATRALLEADVSRARRKKTVDKLAAALILETYLARRRA
ncbi:MAG: Holliday junction resolvase RuvX, partial [Candidatus Eremiobacteraeota bacterium]|nr:Holliday junction resolvase RuvX [Candidatus Eremiobacteraeota bacterium]